MTNRAAIESAQLNQLVDTLRSTNSAEDKAHFIATFAARLSQDDTSTLRTDAWTAIGPDFIATLLEDESHTIKWLALTIYASFADLATDEDVGTVLPQVQREIFTLVSSPSVPNKGQLASDIALVFGHTIHTSTSADVLTKCLKQAVWVFCHAKTPPEGRVKLLPLVEQMVASFSPPLLSACQNEVTRFLQHCLVLLPEDVTERRFELLWCCGVVLFSRVEGDTPTSLRQSLFQVAVDTLQSKLAAAHRRAALMCALASFSDTSNSDSTKLVVRLAALEFQWVLAQPEDWTPRISSFVVAAVNFFEYLVDLVLSRDWQGQEEILGVLHSALIEVIIEVALHLQSHGGVVPGQPEKKLAASQLVRLLSRFMLEESAVVKEVAGALPCIVRLVAALDPTLLARLLFPTEHLLEEGGGREVLSNLTRPFLATCHSYLEADSVDDVDVFLHVCYTLIPHDGAVFQEERRQIGQLFTSLPWDSIHQPRCEVCEEPCDVKALFLQMKPLDTVDSRLEIWSSVL